jgi:hypothetical protein
MNIILLKKDKEFGRLELLAVNLKAYLEAKKNFQINQI